MRFSFVTLGAKGVRFYWRTHASVFAGTVIAAAVFVGALLVGDSVKYSLNRFALLRLGRIHHAMNSRDRFFRQELAERMGTRLDSEVTALLKLNGIMLKQDASGGDRRQVNHVQVLGVAASFWRFGPGSNPDLGEDQIALNEKLAARLDARVGDELSLRVSKPTLMPRQAPLSSRKEKLSEYGTFTLSRIVKDDELGRFNLAANQIAPYNAFVSRTWLQKEVKLPRRANLLLVGEHDGHAPRYAAVTNALAEAWDIGDVGIAIERHGDLGLIQLQSDRIFLDHETTRAALETTGGDKGSHEPVGILSYLVNSLVKQGGADDRNVVAYSLVNACTPSADRRVSLVPSDMQDTEIILNTWAAEQLDAGPGDAVELAYMRLARSGTFETGSRSFTVRSVVSMAEMAREKELMPVFPGLTDANQCREWDVGMPMDQALLTNRANEAYWNEYRDTPKALVTLEAGKDMWANQFGDLSAIRYSADGVSPEVLERQLNHRINPIGLGLFPVPVRAHAMKAVDEAMNLGEWFLYMSFFLIVAALMLTGLLFVFGVQSRAEEMGTLLAVGFRPRHVRQIFLWEGGLIALVGSVLGALAGTWYTRGLIWGLSTHWQGAIAGAAIQYHATAGTVLGGIAASFFCAVGSVAVAMWRQTKRTAHELLVLDLTQEVAAHGRRRSAIGLLLAVLTATGAVVTVAWALASGPADLVPAFFGAGGMLLVSGLAFSRVLLVAQGARSSNRLSIRELGLRNASRRHGRSLTAIGLLACGCFLVMAVQSMQKDVRKDADKRWSGTGGFELFGTSTIASPEPLESDRGRKMLNLDHRTLDGVDILSLKIQEGDDGSCFNLNRAQAPGLIGVDPEAMITRGAFVGQGAGQDPWKLLQAGTDEQDIVPGLAGDATTLMWGLDHKKAHPEHGHEIAYKDERGRFFKVRLVGMLPAALSVFQGTILISAADFGERFPSKDGYHVFLVDTPSPDRVDDVRRFLTRRLSRVGLELTTSTQRLVEFNTVESTYLAMFLVLGGLGLLLGSVGMGVVVLRNVLERRREFALLRCVGFSRERISAVVIAEHWLLVVLGLGVGVIASVAAIWPHLQSPGADIPYGLLLLFLAASAAIGFGWIAVVARVALRGELIPALRQE